MPYNSRYISDKVLDEVIAELKNSFKTLGAALKPYGIDESDLTVADLQYINDEIFLCPCCGWWCDLSEAVQIRSGELVCSDCA